MHVWAHSSLVTALSQKRKVSDSIAFVLYIELHIWPIVFELYVTKKRKKNNNKVDIFTDDFCDFEKHYSTFALS